MPELLRVRLVPKSREGDAITMNLSQMTPQMAKRFAPDPGRASEALRSALHLRMDVKMTPHNSLDTNVPTEEFQTLFSAPLVDKELPPSARATFSRKVGTFLSTYQELTVPEPLADTIAFAYLPTPPLFFAESPIPPNVNVYHLRLMEVLAALNGARSHRRGWSGRGIRVAMTDTGFANHPYFVRHGYNIERVATTTTEHPMVDTSGHGTGESANVLVIAPDCHFIGVKHNDYSAVALETALATNPRIITNSWGWNIDQQSMPDLKNNDPNLFNELRDVENIINDAIDDGVTIIFAAGNGHHAFPASLPNVLAIGGVTVDPDGSLKASSYASSFRSQLYPGRRVPDVCGVVGEASNASPLKGHIMLPVPNGAELEGENMPSTQRNKGWGIFSGTSAAAPQVAGVVALLLSVNTNLTPNQIRAILADTATDVTRGTSGLGDATQIGYDEATGAGFINAFQACLRAENLVTG